ncbi:MAG: hypothetical protein IPG50_35350 [Myxococcales bacterium]|nr:hypothetical protein [Myxococcales bacterium]
MTPASLEHAIARLYETFANYRASAVEGCPCCVSPEQRARLTSKRLRELEEGDLGSYVFSALNTWGTLTDFKHFLPRILELKAHGSLWVDLQIIYGKFVQEGPWLPAERAALEAFTGALLASAVAGRARARVRDIVESAGIARMDLAPMLDTMLDRGDDPATSATLLADLVLDEAAALSAGTHGWIFWKDDEDRLYQKWFLSGSVRTRLMEAFEADPNHANAGQWASASDILEALGG